MDQKDVITESQVMQSHDRFYSSNGKRTVLVVEDEMINRELLGCILEDQYNVIYAEDGPEALRVISGNIFEISLIMLDLGLPGISGMDVLRRIKEDPEMQKIPVIILTADQEAEAETLTIGAIDFIPKPYPPAKVILARVLRTIELFEDRQIIKSTERDPLTGLYNKEFFYRYAEQYDLHHPDTDMDAIVIDIHHFHIINDRFGLTFGDSVLHRISENARKTVYGYGGIICRREADTFMIYCPHGADYKAILDSASVKLSEDDASDNHVRLRMGVYANVDKNLDMARRFDRAKMAADMIRSSLTKNIEIYDDKLREKELFSERLIDDFRRAIDEEQFTVFFQPKYNIRPVIPVLSSAEALVRWKHPQLGMISPGVFIPLFEDNGLIQELDHYVWLKTAKQIKAWADKFGYCVPISVNVSRIDLYDPDLITRFKNMIEETGIQPKDLLLEITESAYTGDSDQIINVINDLRSLGFKIEMDDFGSGYSSLNMISTLPIDVLKLDMRFIRSAFEDGKDTRMLEVIIDIAGYLSVPVVAEGVETGEQMAALRSIGCDIVQGYYFSKPVPPADFEAFLVEYGQATVPDDIYDVKKEEGKRSGVTFSRIAHALSRDYFSIYYVDTATDWFVEYSSHDEYQTLGIEKTGNDFFELSRKNVKRVICPEDQSWFLSIFTKENIMKELEKDHAFTMTYRLMINDVPTYVRMKVTRMPDKNDKHIVIGINNVNVERSRLK